MAVAEASEAPGDEGGDLVRGDVVGAVGGHEVAAQQDVAASGGGDRCARVDDAEADAGGVELVGGEPPGELSRGASAGVARRAR